MRVVLIHNLYGKYARGGAERVVELQAKEFLRAGHTVHIISTAPLRLATAAGVHATQEQGVTIHRYSSVNIVSYYHLGKLPKVLRYLWHTIDLFDIHSPFVVKGILKKVNPDVVFTHNVKGMGMRVVRAAATYDHIHVLHDVQLITPSGLVLANSTNREVTVKLARLYRAILQRTFKTVKTVWGQSQWILDFHKGFGFFAEATVEKHPLGVQCLPHDTKTTQRHQLLYVGQIESHKGVKELLEAFMSAQQTNPELTLVIVGDGSQRKILQQKFAHENIKWMGKCNAQEVQVHYEHAGILIVPSLCYENRPNVICEAKQHGLHIIASAIGGMPEFLSAADVQVKPGDVDALARAIIDNV